MLSKLTLPGVNLDVIERWLMDDSVSTTDVGEVLPFAFCVLNENLVFEYINPVGFEWLGTRENVYSYDYLDTHTEQHESITLRYILGHLEQSCIPELAYQDVYHDMIKIWHQDTQEHKLCVLSIKNSKVLARHLVMIQRLSDIHYLKQKIGRLAEEDVFFTNNYHKFSCLTEREKEVLRLLTQGLNNPDVSRQLCISRKTVEQHRKNINRKLGTHSLVDLIKYAQVFDLQD